MYYITVGDKKQFGGGADKIYPNVFHLPEYDRSSWIISLYKLLKLGHWIAAVTAVNGSPKKSRTKSFDLN